MYHFLWILVLSSVAFSQVNTFERFYEQYTACYSAERDNAGNYITAAGSGTQFLPVKMNSEGIILWEGQKVQFNSGSKIVIRVLPDDSYIFAYTDLIGTLRLVKLANSGEQSWQKSISEYTFGEISINAAGDVYVAAEKRADKKIFLIKYSSAGDHIWTKEFSPAYTNLFIKPPDLAINSSNIFLTAYKVIYKLDLEGNIVSEIPATYSYSEITLAPDHFYVTGGGNKLIKFDFQGNIIWTVNLIINNPVYITSLNSIAYLETGKIYLISAEGQITDTLKDVGTIYSIAPDVSGVLAGVALNSMMCLIKTDQNLTYKGLSIFSPLDNILLSFGDSYKMEYRTKNIVSFNLEYSTNNGTSWEVLVSDIIPGNVLSFTLPVIQASGILIRMISGEDKSFVRNYRTAFLGGTNYININNIKMLVTQSGGGSHDPHNNTSGFYWPDNLKTAVYADGLVFGGKINGAVRFNGNIYSDGLVPGIILPDGTPDDKNDPKYAVWKVRKDWETLPPGLDRDKLEYANNNWPAHLGAPFKDVNEDRIYTAGLDIPGIGDETLFYTAHDLDTAAATGTYGSLPFGLQFYTTIFGFKDDPLKDVVFKKYVIVNKGNNYIEDLYFAYWADPDLGGGSDDHAGVDSLLNLAYCYNGDNSDLIYGLAPPAVGHTLIQGPVIPASSTDSAMFDGRWVPGYKNLRSTSFINYVNSTTLEYRDPPIGEYQGTLEFYNYLQGLKRNGTPVVDPYNNNATKFMTGGNPISGVGWYEGQGWPGGPAPSDRRYLLASGPINMAPGDLQEFVVMIGIARGSSNLNSITVLKQMIPLAEEYFRNNYIISEAADEMNIPEDYSLSQNYPNPFNNSTVINFSVPVKSFVNLSVYDITGQKIVDLINGEMQEGRHSFHFQKNSLSSGIYFYRLNVDGKSFIRKMLLLK